MQERFDVIGGVVLIPSGALRVAERRDETAVIDSGDPAARGRAHGSDDGLGEVQIPRLAALARDDTGLALVARGDYGLAELARRRVSPTREYAVDLAAKLRDGEE